MFIIKNIDIGRFGNKLLYYNNLAQVSHYFNHNYSVPRFDYDDIFEFSNLALTPTFGDSIDIDSNFLTENQNINFNEPTIHLQPCLGDLFFKYDVLKTHDIFKFKSNLIPSISNNKIKIGVHFRGTDFAAWDLKAILPTQYYINSINFVLSIESNTTIKLFTDDINLLSYKETIIYLIQNNINYELGNIHSLTNDFIDLSYCDYIISSPSTFAISAGFCGKENKKIIHSKEWVDYQCDKSDKFWVGFNSGGNNNYKKYKLI
jgi:hypothetical protein